MLFFTIKTDEIINGFLVECTGETITGERCVHHVEDADGVRDCIVECADQWRERQSEHEEIADAQKTAGLAQAALKAAQAAGLDTAAVRKMAEEASAAVETPEAGAAAGADVATD